MADLTLPIELLDLPAEGELVTRVTRFETGRIRIRPGRAPNGVDVDVVRLYVPPEDKGHEPPYWDCTSVTLAPSLLTNLPAVVQDGRWIKIRKFGVAPRARFSLEVFPPGQGGPAFYGVRR